MRPIRALTVIAHFVLGLLAGTGSGCGEGSGEELNANHTSPSCGNGVAEAPEACDGFDLAGKTCVQAGYAGGTLRCTAQCGLDPSGCEGVAACGNGLLEPGEGCDDGNPTDGDGCSATCTVELPSTVGKTCAEAVDVSAATFPVALSGTFDVASDPDPSCGDMRWAAFFTYTPSATGWYRIELEDLGQIYSGRGLAVFEGEACDPPGPELECTGSSGGATRASLPLSAGTAYTIVYFASFYGSPIDDPLIRLIPFDPAPGETCETAVDLTGASFPFELEGQFGKQVSENVSCEDNPHNAVYFRFAPAATGWYQLAAAHAELSPLRLAVFEGSPCHPEGPEVICEWRITATLETVRPLEAGRDYLLIVFNETYGHSIVDPRISITPYPVDPGETCAAPLDVTGATFPLHVEGVFALDHEAGGSCQAPVGGVAFFSFTPAQTGTYRVTVRADDLGDSVIAVFTGLDCAPRGREERCVVGDPAEGVVLQLDAGQPYLIARYRDDDTAEPIVNPVIDIAALEPAPGEACWTAVDVTDATFPFVLAGVFDHAYDPGSTCRPEPSNPVHFRYTPAVSQWYQIDLANSAGTNGHGSWIAVRTSSGCHALDAHELVCRWDHDQSGASAFLQAGTEYLITFNAGAAADSMVDPVISISPTALRPDGANCSRPATVSSASHHSGPAAEQCWSFGVGSLQGPGDHEFSCAELTGTELVVEFTTGPTQTTLEYAASLSNGDVMSHLVLEIVEAQCQAAEPLLCYSSGQSLSTSGALAVAPSTTYFVWIADGFDTVLPDTQLCLW